MCVCACACVRVPVQAVTQSDLKLRALKFWQSFWYDYGMCHTKYVQNRFKGAGSGHKVHIPWSGVLKSKKSRSKCASFERSRSRE